MAIGLELSIVELSFVVGDDSLQDPEPSDYVLPCEASDLLLSNGGQGFGFDPLCEVVDANYKKAPLFRCWRERFEKIKPPLGEGLGRVHRGKGDRRLVW